MSNILDGFFNLGNKATGGNPVKKAQFDYYLYWIIFLAFCSISVTYFYNFFFNNAGVSTLLWGIVVLIFCWFNYWGLVAFRGIYQNMKGAKESLRKMRESTEPNKEAVEDMIHGFSDNLKGGRDANE